MQGLATQQLAFLDWKPVDLRVAPGECVGITGESGSGKSLLLRAIADLDVHSGDASLDDERCSRMPATAWRKRVGLLPAESRWWFDDVRPHFEGAGPGGLFEALGLPAEVIDWEIARLSAGERQRLGLARLLSRRPRALLLDEPTANLDEATTRRVETLLLDYLSENGAPVLWVSHNADQLERVTARRFEMKDRRLTPTGSSR